MTRQRVVHEPALPGQVAGEQRVILREADRAAERLLPDRTAEPLRERDDGVPALSALADRADDERRRLRGGEQVGKLGHLRGVDRVRAEDPRGRTGREVVGRLEPVAHRDHEQRRAFGGLGLVVRARDRAGHVLAASGQMPPHGILARQALELAPGQKRLERDLAAVLLADDDYERGAAVAGIRDRVDGVAETGRRVQIDERGLAPG